MRMIPVVTFPNAAGDILAYLVKRTSETIGEQVDRTQAIVVGRVEKTEGHSAPVRPEHTTSLKPWMSEGSEGELTIFVQVTRVQVERWLTGPADSRQLDIVYVYAPAVTRGAAGFVPVLYAEERGLLFLKRVRPDVPYAPYVPRAAYELVEGEAGVRSFLVTDYDDKGQPFVRDETVKVEETIAAIQWYDSLRREKPEQAQKTLLQGLDSPNPQITRHAIRSLARAAQPNTAEAFKERVQRASPDLRVRYMLGLWIIGERKLAESLLHDLFETYGKDTWLDTWDIKSTLVEEGEQVETLYGPDPSEVRGE